MSVQAHSVAAVPGRPTRPNDSGELIARHAEELFGSRGFPAVRMADIGARIGVTARAIYHHYPDKQALLFEICRRAQAAYLEVLDRHRDVPADPVQRLDGAMRACLCISLDHRDHAMLWQRDGRYLEAGQRQALADGIRSMVDAIAELAAAADGAAVSHGHHLRARAMLSVMTSPGHHPLQVPRPETDALLAYAIQAVAAADLPDVPRRAAGPPISDAGRRKPAVMDSRTEALLSAATTRFARSGYAGVTLEDIAAEVGILGPSIYHYFENKAEILIRLTERWHDWVTLGYLRAAAGADDPTTVLRRFFTEFRTLACEFPDLYGVALTERVHLPDRVRRQLYPPVLRTVTNTLRRARPGLSPTAASSLMYAAIIVIGDFARSPAGRRSPDIPALVDAIVEAILFATTA